MIYENTIFCMHRWYLEELTNHVVDVNTVSQFKARLDKFWMHQYIKSDFTADLTGIGDNMSVHEICEV